MELIILLVVYTFIIGGFLFDTWLTYLNYSNRNAPIPEEVKDVHDQEDYKKWLEYTMEKNRFAMVVKTINVIIFVSLLSLGIFVWFKDLSESLFSNYRLQILWFMFLYYLVSFVLGIFVSYYNTFKIEEKFGFNKTTIKTFVLDKIKGFIIAIILGGGLIYLLLVINSNAGNLFFLYAWLSLVAIIFIVNILYVPVFVPLFNKLTPLEEGELSKAIHEFANSVGYEVAKISVMDASRRSTKLNAFFSGFGKFKNIVLYDTLIEKMSTEEIVAVLAHEIGHNKFKHVWFNLAETAIQFLIYIGVFVMVLNNNDFSTAFGFNTSHFGFSIILFVILLEPVNILFGMFSMTFSRKHEYQADAYAANNLKKEPMVTALKVLSRANYSNLTPHPLYVKMYYSHPPTVDRIRAINKIET
ncbi:M48 family metallopeptidase [Candidatus Xianfuyuplasma coldseepsis]|uniref:M48 family metallopeptidase n=1 Tax=Candidatus Xianfuyuplasma coldseepsis TaxID=2782163 RepID=A0A7L7KPZ2_9MOLU|nr:M48 family metallopeptidase [Xianfuyuplasma coldseepsis]QMS84747.1 M48 family metallopeptidase [Xianfuyuplasma coldseepsis]